MALHQNELFPNETYNKSYIKEQIVYLWNLPGINGITPDEMSEYTKIVDWLDRLTHEGNTLNLHYFFNCVEQVIKDKLMTVSETHFASIIYLCVPLKNRTSHQEDYFQALNYFYNTWVKLLKKKHSLCI